MIRKYCFYGLLLILLVPAVLLTSCADDEEETQLNQGGLTKEEFNSLLTVQDVQQVLAAQVELNTQFYNYKEMAESEDPEQVAAMDSFYGLSFETEDGMKSITLTVIDFDSTSSAEQYIQDKENESEWDSMQNPIGDESLEEQLNSEGMGSIIIFLKGDKCVQLHTTISSGDSPITDLNGLEELADKVEAEL